jgi:hypothetical protein
MELSYFTIKYKKLHAVKIYPDGQIILFNKEKLFRNYLYYFVEKNFCAAPPPQT